MMRIVVLALMTVSVSGLQGCPFKPLHTLPMLQNMRELPTHLAIGAASSPATPIEIWTADRLESMYHETGAIKCPFFRRRASDILDALDMIARFLVVRHKSLDLPLGMRMRAKFMEKQKNLEINRIFNILLRDWRIDTDKGYYITGRLNSTIYREDCLFDGPDPDMPVRGLRKFLNAASQLFEYKSSRAELKSLRVENPKLLVAEWRMEGVLRLPWHPVLPEWGGKTFYHLDDQNLIYLHEETWDMSVAEAFIRTLSPQIGDKIWNSKSIF
jgi:hypothetical protein